jgi:predicted porin
VTPFVLASLRKRYRWGPTLVSYNREVDLAGGLGGTADNQTATVAVAVTTLMRGLSLEVAPQYRTMVSDDDTIDVRQFTLPLRATYQITPWFSFFAGYGFLHQKSDSTVRSTTTGELLGRNVDQNRVFVGMTFGYPIKFD